MVRSLRYSYIFGQYVCRLYNVGYSDSMPLYFICMDVYYSSYLYSFWSISDSDSCRMYCLLPSKQFIQNFRTVPSGENGSQAACGVSASARHENRFASTRRSPLSITNMSAIIGTAHAMIISFWLAWK